MRGVSPPVARPRGGPWPRAPPPATPRPRRGVPEEGRYRSPPPPAPLATAMPHSGQACGVSHAHRQPEAGLQFSPWPASGSLVPGIARAQSATGILYAGVILTFLGELTSQLLSVDTLYPI